MFWVPLPSSAEVAAKIRGVEIGCLLMKFLLENFESCRRDEIYLMRIIALSMHPFTQVLENGCSIQEKSIVPVEFENFCSDIISSHTREQEIVLLAPSNTSLQREAA